MSENITMTTVSDASITDSDRNVTSSQVTIATDAVSMEIAAQILFGVYVYPFSLIFIYMVVGFIGNVIVIFIFKFHWKMKKTTVYILALSSVDLFSCSFNMPVELSVLFNPVSFDYNAICKIARFTSFLTTASTSFILVVIAIDRYLMVCHPLTSIDLGVRFAKRACTIAIALGIVSSIPGFIIYGTYEFSLTISEYLVILGKTCYVTNYFKTHAAFPLSYLIFIFAGHIIIFVIFIVLYVLIGRRIFLSISMNMRCSRTNSLKAFGRGLMAAITGNLPVQFQDTSQENINSEAIVDRYRVFDASTAIQGTDKERISDENLSEINMSNSTDNCVKGTSVRAKSLREYYNIFASTPEEGIRVSKKDKHPWLFKTSENTEENEHATAHERKTDSPIDRDFAITDSPIASERSSNLGNVNDQKVYDGINKTSDMNIWPDSKTSIHEEFESNVQTRTEIDKPREITNTGTNHDPSINNRMHVHTGQESITNNETLKDNSVKTETVEPSNSSHDDSEYGHADIDIQRATSSNEEQVGHQQCTRNEGVLSEDSVAKTDAEVPEDNAPTPTNTVTLANNNDDVNTHARDAGDGAKPTQLDPSTSTWREQQAPQHTVARLSIIRERMFAHLKALRYRMTKRHVTITIVVLIAICYVWLTYVGRQTISLDEYQHSEHCMEEFHENFEDNLAVIANYPIGVADKYLPLIGGNQDKPKEIRSFPVFVTGANSQYYERTKQLLHNLQEHLGQRHKNMEIVYFDLGLSNQQKDELTEFNVEVRLFPFHLFPGHVRQLKVYAWKPIIIQMMLMEYGVVWWLDSSIRFLTDDLGRALDYAKKNGVLYYTNEVPHMISLHTDVRTMSFLGEDPCKFRQFPEAEPGFSLFYWSNTSRILVRSWVACALNEDCIAPKGTDKKLYCPPRVYRDGICHRFDQSVFSIMTRRLFHARQKYPDVERPLMIHVVDRGGCPNRKYT